MCDTVFAFGQRGSYFLESPSTWKYADLPASLLSLFTNSKVRSTYCVVLGAGTSYVISYKGKDDQIYLACEALPHQLEDWLYAKDAKGDGLRDLKNLRVVLGPFNQSFYASDGKSKISENLPAGLQESLSLREDGKGWYKIAPRIIALGARENYLMITERGGGDWDLSNYPAVEATMAVLKAPTGGLKLIKNVYLDPHRFKHSLMLSSTGAMIQENSPLRYAGMLAQMGETIQADSDEQRRRALNPGISKAEYTKLCQEIISIHTQSTQSATYTTKNYGNHDFVSGYRYGTTDVFDATAFWKPILTASADTT